MPFKFLIQGASGQAERAFGCSRVGLPVPSTLAQKVGKHVVHNAEGLESSSICLPIISHIWGQWQQRTLRWGECLKKCCESYINLIKSVLFVILNLRSLSFWIIHSLPISNIYNSVEAAWINIFNTSRSYRQRFPSHWNSFQKKLTM